MALSVPMFTDTRRWKKSKGANNCYAYAVGDFRKMRSMKSVPGYRAGIQTNHPFTFCKGIKELVLKDGNGNILLLKKPEGMCPKGWHKVALVTSPQGDFHWARLNKSVEYFTKSRDTLTGVSKFFGVPLKVIKEALTKATGEPKMKPHTKIRFRAHVWSHKRGWATPPLLTGSDGKAIRSGHKMKLAYRGMNYSNYCNSFCVKTGKVKVGPKKQPMFRLPF